LFAGYSDIPALAAQFAAKMLGADSANAAAGDTLHGGDKRAGVVHGNCFLRFVSHVRQAAGEGKPFRSIRFRRKPIVTGN
jgi:hypothetical protein